MSTLLIVEDTAICRESIAEILRKEGYTALCASNGKEALDLLKSNKVDLLLLDLIMPGIDGLTLLAMLRRNLCWNNLPVIFLTDVADAQQVRNAAQLGVQGYLLKSHFTVDELLSRVKAQLLETLEPAPHTIQKSSVTTHKSEAGIRTETDTKRSVADSSNGLAALKPAPASSCTKERSQSEVLARMRRHFQLKSVPPVLQYVISLASSSRSSIDEIVNAVRQDQGLAIRVMKMANSSFYMTDTRAQNLIEATQRIGLSGLRNAAAAILAIDHFTDISDGGLIPQRFWEHSLATAVLAQNIAENLGIEEAEELFLAGLLHDIGRLVLSSVFPEDYRNVLSTGEERAIDLIHIEQEAFGLNHADITAEVLKGLNMPDGIVTAASLHSRPINELNRSRREHRNAMVVSLANRIAHAMVLGDSGNSILHPFHEVADALGLSHDRIGMIARAAADRARDAEIIYACHTDIQFRESLAIELGNEMKKSVRLKVLSNNSPNDPVSLFCERLGVLVSDSPNAVILYANSSRELATACEELQQLERIDDNRTSVVLALGNKNITIPRYLQDYAYSSITIPTNYAMIGQAFKECLASSELSPTS